MTPADFPSWAFVFACETALDFDAPLADGPALTPLVVIRAYGGGRRVFVSAPDLGDAWDMMRAALEGVES